jgi:hypothetical protein
LLSVAAALNSRWVDDVYSIGAGMARDASGLVVSSI